MLRHFLGKETHVKCEGRRDFTGIVLSYDSYGNLVLGNTTELIMEYPDEDDDMPVFTGRTRFLGQLRCPISGGRFPQPERLRARAQGEAVRADCSSAASASVAASGAFGEGSEGR